MQNCQGRSHGNSGTQGRETIAVPKGPCRLPIRRESRKAYWPRLVAWKARRTGEPCFVAVIGALGRPLDGPATVFTAVVLTYLAPLMQWFCCFAQHSLAQHIDGQQQVWDA